jgi:hypothetical protein
VDVQRQGLGEKEDAAHERTFPSIFISMFNKSADSVQVIREVVQPFALARFPRIVSEFFTDPKIILSIRAGQEIPVWGLHVGVHKGRHEVEVL